MAVELATAYVSIVPSTRGMAGDLARELRGPLDRAGTEAGDTASRSFGASFTPGLRRFAAAAGGLLVANLGVSAIRDTIGAASDLNETISQSETIFGSAASGIRSWAQDAANNLGQSEQQALQAAASFGNMFTQLGLGSGVAADMSTSMTELASDFASFHNADITQVLEAQQAAFRGEYDAVQRFVPTINAAAVEQRALEMGLAATTSELDAQDKALATQALLMEGAGAAAGDFGRTSDDLANQQRILAANVENLQARFGQALLPAMTAVTTWAVDSLIPAIRDLAGYVRTEVVPRLQEFAAWLDQNVVPALQTTGEFISTNVVPTLQTLARFFVDHVVPAIAAVAEFIFTVLLPAFAEIIAKATEVAAWIGARVDEIVGFFAAVGGRIIGAAGDLFGFVRTKASEAKDWVGERINEIVGLFTGLPGRISSAAGDMFDFLGDGLRSVLQRIANLWNNFRFPSWTMPSVSIPGVGTIGGSTIGGWSLPRITVPAFHTGGIVPGAPGEEVLIRALAGETILPTHDPSWFRDVEMGGGGITLTVDGMDHDLVRMIAKRVRIDGGGNVQAVLGGAR